MSEKHTHLINIESGCYMRDCDVVGCIMVTDIRITTTDRYSRHVHTTYLCEEHAATLPIIGMIFANMEI